MEIKKLSKTKDKLTFEIRGINHSYVNTIRRLILSEVPTLAIEDVEFKKNHSILYDEIVAHRLGLVPLKTDLKSADEKTEVQFTLKTKGPGYVYASDLKSKDTKCKPVHPKMPIVKLLEKQELQLVATAKLGNGKQHMKWSPGAVYYTQESTITINNKSPKLEEFKSKYPPQAFDKKGQLDKKGIIDNNLVDACEGVCEEVLKVDYSNTDFIFTVESWGQLECKEMVVKAIDIFNNQLTEFSKLIKK
ncbi:MAG: DNA-directed RNA polymerase subunit D [Nanoarchaeota archaeon]|nr:DNA-directed RNA polymerase subunit D [Nanoarchaeota archaeon]MBU1854843.1 DNA-directed RNA polymerase subunit D [Nanoarchaeota archaeon]